MSQAVNISAETRSRRVLMGLLAICAVIFSLGLAIQRNVLLFDGAPSAFAAGVMPGAAGPLVGSFTGRPGMASAASRAFRFAAPSTIRRSIPAGRTLGGILPVGENADAATRAALAPDGGAEPAIPGLDGGAGGLGPAGSPAGSSGGTDPNTGMNPLPGADTGTQGGGGGTILTPIILVPGAVPEPATWLTMILGVMAIALRLRHRPLGRMHPTAA